MRGSFTEYNWQPCNDSAEAALTRSFASRHSPVWLIQPFHVKFARADADRPGTAGAL